jgi:fructose-bisphosphate aldolase class I
MSSQDLAETARALIADDEGILAMDESNPTCDKRFGKLGTPRPKRLGEAGES